MSIPLALSTLVNTHVKLGQLETNTFTWKNKHAHRQGGQLSRDNREKVTPQEHLQSCHGIRKKMKFANNNISLVVNLHSSQELVQVCRAYTTDKEV